MGENGNGMMDPALMVALEPELEILTDKRAEQLAAAVGRGLTLVQAAALHGISDKTLKFWMERAKHGPDPDGRYLGLRSRLRKSAAEFVNNAAVQVEKSIVGGDVKTAMWALERRDPENWAPRNTVDINATVTEKPVIKIHWGRMGSGEVSAPLAIGTGQVERTQLEPETEGTAAADGRAGAGVPAADSSE